MDLLESGDEREPVTLDAVLAVRLPTWAVGAVGAGVALALTAGVIGAVAVRRAVEREAARPDVAVIESRTTSSTVAGVARGALELVLLNNGRDPVLVEVGLVVEGLRVTGGEPMPIGPVAPGARRTVRVPYLVPSCASLVLPGVLVVEAGAERQQLPVVDPDADSDPDGIELGSCPASARSARPGEPTDLGARSAGGTATRVGAGAAGRARLEIRNGGPPVRLLSVSAHVPGALFVSRLIDGGLTLETDGLALITLGFSVRDCARLEKTGALLIRIERFGGVQELRLPVSSGLTGDAGPQVDLRVVLDSCD